MCVVTYVVTIIEVFVHSERHLQLFDHLFDMAKDPSKRFCDKLLKLKVKGGVLVPVLTAMKGVWLHGLFNMFGKDAVVFIYFNCAMFLRCAQFYMISDGIRIKLEIIYEDLMDLLETEKEKVAIDLKSVRVRMEKIRTDYLYLKDLSVTLNDSDAWSLLFLILLFTSFLICTSYWFLLGLYKDIKMLEPHQNICYIVFTFLVLTITNHLCTLCLGLVTLNYMTRTTSNFFFCF